MFLVYSPARSFGLELVDNTGSRYRRPFASTIVVRMIDFRAKDPAIMIIDASSITQSNRWILLTYGTKSSSCIIFNVHRPVVFHRGTEDFHQPQRYSRYREDTATLDIEKLWSFKGNPNCEIEQTQIYGQHMAHRTRRDIASCLVLAPCISVWIKKQI